MNPSPKAYLIDGYNLLHAMGILLGKVGPHGLEKARANLLGILAGSFGAEANRLTVVFDAASARVNSQARQVQSGIIVLYSVGRPAADDLIEDLIAAEQDPEHLAVVSDDRRLQHAAKRERPRAMPCDEFLDVLESERPRHSEKPAEGRSDPKIAGPSEAEARFWLEEFRELHEELGKPEYSLKPEKLRPRVPPGRKRPPGDPR